MLEKSSRPLPLLDNLKRIFETQSEWASALKELIPDADKLKRVVGALDDINQQSDKELYENLVKQNPNIRISNYAFDPKIYRTVLQITTVMCALENTKNADVDAYKLSVMLGTVNGVVDYLKKHNVERPVYEACLFDMPQKDGWDILEWQLFCRNYLLTDRVKKEGFIPNAAVIDLKKLSPEIREALKNPSALPNKKLIGSEKQTAQKLFDDMKNIVIKLRYSRADEDKKASEIFYECENQGQYIPESVFNEYLDKLKPKILASKGSDDSIPRIFSNGKNIIDGADFDCKGYYVMKLSHGDPKGAVLGYLTACCQSLGREGASCANLGMTNKDSGFYVICRGKPPKDGNTINILPKNVVGQMWAWKGNDGNTIMLDSLEFQPNMDSRKMGKLATVLAKELSQLSNVDNVQIGKGGRTPEMLSMNEGRGTTSKIFPTFSDDYHTDARERADLYGKKSTPITSLVMLEPEKTVKEYLSSKTQHRTVDRNIVYMLLKMDYDQALQTLLNEPDKKRWEKVLIDAGVELLSEAARHQDVKTMERLAMKSDYMEKILNSPHRYKIMEDAILYGGNPSVIQFLLDKGAVRNPGERFGLFLYTMREAEVLRFNLMKLGFENKQTVLALLGEGGVIINGHNSKHQTPLGEAILVEDAVSIQTLLEIGADKTFAFKQAIIATDSTLVEKFLNAKYFDANSVLDEAGITPLMLASQHGHTSVMRTLLQAGADIEAKDKSGKNAWDYSFSTKEQIDAFDDTPRSLLTNNCFKNINSYVRDIHSETLRNYLLERIYDFKDNAISLPSASEFKHVIDALYDPAVTFEELKRHIQNIQYEDFRNFVFDENVMGNFENIKKLSKEDLENLKNNSSEIEPKKTNVTREPDEMLYVNSRSDNEDAWILGNSYSDNEEADAPQDEDKGEGLLRDYDTEDEEGNELRGNSYSDNEEPEVPQEKYDGSGLLRDTDTEDEAMDELAEFRRYEKEIREKQVNTVACRIAFGVLRQDFPELATDLSERFSKVSYGSNVNSYDLERVIKDISKKMPYVHFREMVDSSVSADGLKALFSDIYNSKKLYDQKILQSPALSENRQQALESTSPTEKQNNDSSKTSFQEINENERSRFNLGGKK